MTYIQIFVISDIKMPFMDGLELAKTIHDNYMNTKVILFLDGMILNMQDLPLVMVYQNI